jgi:SAM-dependent methyltransferase
MNEDALDKARAVNAAIARNYDALVYETQPAEIGSALDPAPVLGLAGLYGCASARSDAADVLDLGCGTGTQLLQVGSQTRGHVVGVDISEIACERARIRCAKLGDRAKILRADFLDLNPDTLGRFDLIYHIGVIFVTPAPVQARILELIGRCLKPGGAAVLTYYAGSLPLIRQSLHRLLRTTVDPLLGKDANIKRARQRLEEIAAALPAAGPHRPVLAQALDYARTQADRLFFHEALNHAFAVLNTGDLEAALAPHGVQFLDYVTPTAFGALPTSTQRALAADVVDFASGGSYRYAVFGKPAAGGGAFSFQSPGVRWKSDLTRSAPDRNYDGAAAYKHRVTKLEAQILRPETQAAVDVMAGGPASWPKLIAGVTAQLAARGRFIVGDPASALEPDLLELWRNRLVTPLWMPEVPG